MLQTSMLQIKSDFSLRKLNTFQIDVQAACFCEVTSVDELKEALDYQKTQDLPLLILGSGSNILFTKDFNGLVVKINLKGTKKVKNDATHIYIRVGAGEIWHDFVKFCIANNYAGVENLSLIYGTVGAAPMQNIGAYGVEIKDIFEDLEALNIETGEIRTFNNEECKFGYRESIFKNELKGKYIITSVTFRLGNKTKKPKLSIAYGDIQKTLLEMRIPAPTIADVSAAVVTIRTSKLPIPAQIGNAGSFFKNPTIKKKVFEKLKKKFENMPSFPVDDDNVKIPAGWLIEQCELKGLRVGEAGVHAKQALVLVNYGKAKGQEIKDLADKVQETVKEKFGITLSMEVNLM